MSESSSNDSTTLFVAGAIAGAFIGFLIALMVVSHNNNYDESEQRKKMVELGVGSYDVRTGQFQVRACVK